MKFIKINKSYSMRRRILEMNPPTPIDIVFNKKTYAKS